MFLDLNQVYYLRFKWNTRNNYNYIIKTKKKLLIRNYLQQKEETPSKLGLGLW